MVFILHLVTQHKYSPFNMKAVLHYCLNSTSKMKYIKVFVCYVLKNFCMCFPYMVNIQDNLGNLNLTCFPNELASSEKVFFLWWPQSIREQVKLKFFKLSCLLIQQILIQHCQHEKQERIDVHLIRNYKKFLISGHSYRNRRHFLLNCIAEKVTE